MTRLHGGLLNHPSRRRDGSVMPDRFGGTLDASGEFDDLLQAGISPMPAWLDLHDKTTWTNSDHAALSTVGITHSP